MHGVYQRQPPPGTPGLSAIPLAEAVPLLGLDSTRILRQMSHITRLKDAIESILSDALE